MNFIKNILVVAILYFTVPSVWGCDVVHLIEKKVVASVASLEEAERQSLEEIRLFPHVPQVPFGFMNEQWNRFIKEYDGEKDCLIKFQGSEGAEGEYRGTGGYMIKRGGEIIDVIYLSVE